MKLRQTKPISLTEHHLTELKEERLTEKEAEKIYHQYGTYIKIQVPSFLNDHHWQLTSQGYVGLIALSNRVWLELLPKVDYVQNLFEILSIAYDPDGKFLTSDTPVQADKADIVAGFYERLAMKLAKLILRMRRRGLHCAFGETTDRLPFIRGRLDCGNLLQRPWDTTFRCRFDAHTPDIEDNQLLTWTLYVILRTGLLSSKSIGLVQRAYHTLRGSTSLKPFTAADCLNRRYDRINEPYRLLHGLCRFFLENTGPGHHLGDHVMYSYLVPMSHVYQNYVTNWLTKNLPKDYKVSPSEKAEIYGKKDFYIMDVVIRYAADDRVKTVIDLKYKIDSKVDKRDFNQVFAYAKSKDCEEAVLVYPQPLTKKMSFTHRGIRIRSLTFPLDCPPEEAGASFLGQLGL